MPTPARPCSSSCWALTATKKQPSQPHTNVEAERAVLGALLLVGADGDYDECDPILALLTEDDFYEPRHALVYRAIKALRAADQAPGATLVNDWLMNNGELGAAGQTLTHELTNL